MTQRPAPAPPKLALVLLGLMTVLTFAGPFVVWYVVRGGRSHVWPPDRPIEWWTFGLITGGVVVLMIGCLASAAMAMASERKRASADSAYAPRPTNAPEDIR